MAAVDAAKNVQPDQEHGRPQKENFDGKQGKEQAGFSRQC